MEAIGAGAVFPGARDLVHGRLVEIAPDKLHRQRQTIRRHAGEHRQGRVAGDVERCAGLARIGARDLLAVLDAAGWVHRAGAKQHIDLAQRRLDSCDHLQPPPLGLDIVARAEWRTPEDVKASYPKASILKAGRVVFNIKGNDFRLVARVQYQAGVLMIRFFGTHAEYDEVDVETV